MKHKIELITYDYNDSYGTSIKIDGNYLSVDATDTYCCLEEVLKFLNVDFEIEYLDEHEVNKIVTKKMKLVPVTD